MRMRPYRTLDDKIEGVVVTFVDVTERQEAEAKWEGQQKLLLAELAHRVKNSLTVVQAIVTRTLHDSGASQEAQDALSARLTAVGKSHDLLVSHEWSGADFAAIARDQLAAYLSEKPARIRLEGPSVQLASDQAVPLGLLLNELATNAAKYGALSKAKGKVTLTWEVIQADRGHRLRLVWTERGGPPVSPPKTEGFGTFLIKEGVSGAQVEQDFQPEGVVCTIELPL
jgi:Signal transduction histidine kinase